MKIFSRGAEKPAEPAPKVEAAPAPAPVAEAPPAPAAAPPIPDLTSIIDANVKEMSEKIARLASTIESEQHDRADFQAKIEKMEDRMRKLSSLTEMVSAQYNPFVGAAPPPAPMPDPEVGLAMPQSAPAAAAPAAPSEVDADAALALTIDAPLPETPLPDAPPAPRDAPAPRDVRALFDAPLLPTPARNVDFADDMPEAPSYALPAFEPEPEPAPAPLAIPRAPPRPPAGAHARLVAAPEGFAASMLMLDWVEMLLRNVPTREALVDVLAYYQTIGWIGEPARDALLAYANGLAHTESDKPLDWRANADVHQRSLLYIEKLRLAAND